MTSDNYTKVILTLTTLTLSLITLRSFIIPGTIVSAQGATGQKSYVPLAVGVWEYKTLYRTRKPNAFAGPTDWSDWDESGDRTSGAVDADVDEKLTQLGRAGWDLATVSSRSDYSGFNSGNVAAHSDGGVTTSELWIFKRPKR